MKRVLFLFSVIIFISSCNSNLVYKEIRKFEKVSWNRFDIQNFEVPVTAGEELDFFLFLRHHTYFPYDKLFVSITFFSPSGDERSAEYDFNLKDEKGKWLADGMGELWDIELPIRQNMKFSSAGICKVQIQNLYSKTETPGIVEIGLIARKSSD
ncbi:MAG TPA: gliding motility lipoprotein GldH [Bacteroidales bacterium]